jgi:alanine dehydrogenase
MRIGVPRAVKDGERRVSLVPDGIRALVGDGHDVIVEHDAGRAAGFNDAEYARAGAVVRAHASEVWSAPLVVKVKEIQPSEYARLVRGTTIFGFAQLARDRELLGAVLASGVRVVACETVRDAAGALPLVAPMSRIAGRLAPFAGALALGTDRGGSGVLLPGVDDVPGARVVVLGAGQAGGAAANVAARLGCRVTVISRGAAQLSTLAAKLEAEGVPVEAHTFDDLGDAAFAAAIASADLVIGAVLVPGKLSPKLVTREHLRAMRAGSALVDVGIDQGGIAETSRMTKLSAPTYVDEGVVHYCVPNMPALVARTATEAFAASILPYVRSLAGRGVTAALTADAGLAEGAMVWEGSITHAGLAADTRYPMTRGPWRA